MDGSLKAGEVIFKTRLPSIFQDQFQIQFLRSQCPGLQSRAQLIKHSTQHKCKRLEQDQRRLQFHRFLKYQRRVRWNQSPQTHATGFLLKFEPSLSQSLTQRYFGQSSQVAEFADTPAPESLQKFLALFVVSLICKKNVNRQATQKSRFFSFRHHSDATKPVCGEQSRLQCGRHSYVRFEAHIRSAARNRAGNVGQGAEELVEARQIEQERVWRGILDPRRKRLRAI